MAGITLLLANAQPIRPLPSFEIDVIQDFCACDFRCDFEEKVFASDKSDFFENDFTDFLFKKISPSDTITFELYRYGKKVATIVDDTYGVYYPVFDDKPMYVGWVADWTKIFNTFTGGLYQVKVITTILGQESTFESRYFRLNVFDPKEAQGTVKIESYQNGIIQSSDFDYNGLLDGGWYSSIRLYGNFGEVSPTLERDIYTDDNYTYVQNFDSVERQYNLNCNIIPESIYDTITTKDFLGNQIFVTNYDLFEEKKYRRYPVVAQEYSDTSYLSYNRLNFKIVFGDRQKNINKRNF